jgi:hypothetical protein
MSDELQLNSLDRFRKDPGRLVLEEHGSCEVPAGCGGVVLRWRMPRPALSIILYCYHAGQGTWWLDGAELSNSRVDLQPGRHVLGCGLRGVDLSNALILFAAVAESPPSARPRPERPRLPDFKVVSAADDTWKFSLNPPSDWLLLSFNVGTWPSLVDAALPNFTRNEPGLFLSQRSIRRGAACLGLPREHATEAGATRGSVWIRKVFEVPDLDSISTPA